MNFCQMNGFGDNKKKKIKNNYKINSQLKFDPV